jgi:tRNA modification GTPase
VDPASGEIVDEALVLPMLAPRSYTTEDVVEIHCHGGSVCVQRVLALLVNAGGGRSGSGTGGARGTDEEDAKDAAIPAVRLARAGEFTLRAFLNGRIDLTQAEAVQSLVSAKTTVAASSALASLRGGLATPVKDARRVCVDLLAELEARLDFDDEMDPLDEDGVATSVERAEAKIREVLATARRGALLDAGVVVAIVGRPTAGKSSLLNAWTRSERAIVTPIAGTTRDVVEASINVRGVPVTLLDTAGIRFGVGIDEVEAMGVERSRAALAGADVVVFVVDASEGWTDGDDDILRGITGERVVIEVGVGGGGEGDDDGVDEWANAMTRLKRVRGGALAEATRRASSSSSSSFSRVSGGRTAVLALNKMDAIEGAGGSMTDVMERLPARVKDGAFASTVTLSATRGDGVDDLERALAEVIGGGDVDVEGAAWVANQRQAEALTTALDALSRLKDTIAEGLPVDFWTIDLREAALALGEVTGEDVAEDVLDVIFTKFCIGK